MTEKDIETLVSIKNDLKEARKKYDSIYTRVKEDQIFTNAINGQFTKDDKSERGENRGEFSFPILDKFVEKVVGNYDTHPYGINYSSYRPENNAKARLLSAIVRGIENRSKANMSYRTALRSAVTTGYGWLYATTEYANPEDDSLDVEIYIEHILNPASVLIDPLSNKPDGSDAEWVAHVDYISPSKAKSEYGDEVLAYVGKDNEMFDSAYLSRSENDVVPVISYYKKHKKSTQVWIDQDGNAVEEELASAKTKMKTTCTVKLTKIVGNKIVYKSDLKIKELPIIPVFGLPVYEGDSADYLGIPHRAKDGQRLLNYSASLGIERLALSPKANYVAPLEGLESTAEQWKNSAKSNPPVLLYNAFTKDGQPIPQPQRQDTSVNLGDIISSQQSMITLIGEIIGMPNGGIGGEGPRNETAEAALLRARSTETVFSTFYENLAVSIEQLGKVILQMLSVNYDTERNVPMVVDGKPTRDVIDFSNLNILPTDFEVAIDAGPLMSTQRKENLRTLMALGSLVGPQFIGHILPEMVQNIDIDDEGGVLAQKMQMISQQMIQPQTNPEQIKQTEMENQALKQQVTELQQALSAQQEQVISTEIKTRADLLKEQMSNENKLDVERLKIEGNIIRDKNKSELESEQKILEDERNLYNLIQNGYIN